MTTLTILACQVDVPIMTSVRERDQHLQRLGNAIASQLKSKPANIVVLPELSSVDYARATFDHLNLLAESLEGISFQMFREIAMEFKTTVAYGFPRKQGEQFYICQAVIGEDGELLGYYDKLHIAQFGTSMEKDYFLSGDHLLVLEHEDIRISPIICYDIRFPELCRNLAIDHGVQLILHCGAYYRDESFHSWHKFAVSRAMENQVYLLSLNRAGVHYGESIFCPPWVDESHPLESFSDHEEEFKYLVLDTQFVEQARKQYPFLKDRYSNYHQIPLLG